MPTARRTRTPTVPALIAGSALVVALAAPTAFGAFRPSFVARRYAVATDNAEASRAAATVLRAGGNAAAGGSGFGGAIFNYSAVLTIQSSTLARNSVAAASGGIADGGALYSFDDRNCGVGGNTCPNGSASSFDLESSIFSNSSATHDVVVNTGSPPAVGTFSDLIVMSRDATQFTIANFASSADPQLSPLGNHGGWTPTMVPKQGSAAIDALTCTSGFARDDQRGVARPYPSSGQCDVGAVEYDGDYIFANGFDY